MLSIDDRSSLWRIDGKFSELLVNGNSFFSDKYLVLSEIGDIFVESLDWFSLILDKLGEERKNNFDQLFLTTLRT